MKHWKLSFVLNFFSAFRYFLLYIISLINFLLLYCLLFPKFSCLSKKNSSFIIKYMYLVLSKYFLYILFSGKNMHKGQIFKCFRVIFSLKRKLSNFYIRSIFVFSKKRAPKLSNCHLPTKRCIWVFDVTNRTNSFSNFQSYHEVVMYVFNSSAKSCRLFWKYS